MQGVERVEKDGLLMAIVIRVDVQPEGVRFFTPDDASLQVGLLQHPQGAVVPRHMHLPVRRSLATTSEVLHVRTGRIEVTLYDEHRQPVRTLELTSGDTILLAGAGHGLRVLEQALILEVKQGPYLGVDDKERF